MNNTNTAGTRSRGTAIACAALLTIAGMQSVHAQKPPVVSDVVGVWTNVNPATPSIAKIVVSGTSTGALTVHGYGACSPTPCDWGSVAANGFSPGVSSNQAESWNAFYNFGFKTDQLTAVRLTSYNGKAGDYLQVTSQSVFAAGDTRYDYVSTDVLVRSPSTIGVLVPLDTTIKTQSIGAAVANSGDLAR
jgi:hypothetical protein